MILTFLILIMVLYLIADLSAVFVGFQIAEPTISVISLLHLFPVILTLILLGNLETLP